MVQAMADKMETGFTEDCVRLNNLDFRLYFAG